MVSRLNKWLVVCCFVLCLADESNGQGADGSDVWVHDVAIEVAVPLSMTGPFVSYGLSEAFSNSVAGIVKDRLWNSDFVFAPTVGAGLNANLAEQKKAMAEALFSNLEEARQKLYDIDNEITQIEQKEEGHVPEALLRERQVLQAQEKTLLRRLAMIFDEVDDPDPSVRFHVVVKVKKEADLKPCASAVLKVLSELTVEDQLPNREPLIEILGEEIDVKALEPTRALVEILNIPRLLQ